MKKMFDEGIKPKLNYREMGKLMINLKLLNNNILLLKYKNSYGPVQGLKRMNISNELKDLLFYILDTNNINYDNIRDLDKNDHDLIIKVLEKSGLDIIYRLDKNKATMNIQDLIDRLTILQGEVEAGNNNIEIINESKDILQKLKKHQRISEEQYNELIDSLDELK